MKIGLVGSSAQQRSLPFDAQDMINLYVVLDQQGKEVAALYGTPGLKLFGNLGSAAVREEFNSETGRAFAVAGSTLYEVNLLGVGTPRGTLNQSAGIVYMTENNNQLAICDGTSLYIFTYATNTFKQVIGGLNYIVNGDFSVGTGWTLGAGWTITGGAGTATTASSAISQNAPAATPITAGTVYTVTYTVTRTAGTITPSVGGTSGISRSGLGTFTETIVAGATQIIAFTGAGFTGTIDNVSITDPAFGLPASVGSVDFLDGFFVVSNNNTGQFNKSAPNNGLSWNALDFATAESSPDNLVRVKAAIGQLWLQGVDTTEIWSNTGAASFPFQKISGGKMTMGCYAPAASLELDNTLFWIGSNKNGFGGVFRANGLIPKKISTEAIDLIIQAAPDPKNIRGYSYSQDGHLFYMITGGGMAVSVCYDITTDEWHKRAYLNSQGAFEPHLSCCYMNAFGKHIVGDRNNGNLYVMDNTYYDDNGAILKALRIYTHLSDEQKRIRYNALVIGVEAGIGNQSGLGFDPSIQLRLSTDGAKTWSDRFTDTIGKVGEYAHKTEFRCLGTAPQMTFEISITDPVKRAITGSYLR